MDANHHILKRPKRKLCYVTNNKSPSKKWEGKLSLSDIDVMFDDLDSSSHDDDIIPQSPPLQTFNAGRIQSGQEISPVIQGGHPTKTSPVSQSPAADILYPTRSLSPELHIDGPIKTSSPIEDNMVVKTVEEEDNERALVVPQILNFEEAKTDPPNAPNPQSNGHITQERDSGELESPPSKITISKPAVSSLKKQKPQTRDGSHSVDGKTPQKCQTPALEVERKTPRRENTEPPVSAQRQDPELCFAKKNSGDERRPSAKKFTRGKNDIEDFLQRVRDAKKTGAPCSKGLQSLVKVPSLPPEPEDEFLILEDDTPFFSIPCKTSNRRTPRQKQTKAEHDSSTEKGMRINPQDTVQNDVEPEESEPKQRAQPIIQKLKKSKGKEKINKVTESENDGADLPAGHVAKQEKPNNRRLKKFPSKDRDGGSREKDGEMNIQRIEGRKPEDFSEVKNSKSLKDGKEKAKRSRAKSLKSVEAAKEQNEVISSKKHADAEDLGACSDKEIVGSKSRTSKAQRNKLAVVSGGSSSEDSQVSEKRKRKQPGQWWLSCPHSTEETEATHNQEAAGPSPGKAKEDGDLKRRSQKRRAPPSNDNTHAAEEKKTKRKQSRRVRKAPDKIQTADQVLEPEQDLQLDVQDQDGVFKQRDLSINTGSRIFQRVYHNISNEKMPRRPVEQLPGGEAEKRRKKAPGNWWLVNDVCELSSSPPQELRHKQPQTHKERKNTSKRSRSHRLGSPKDGNVAVSSKPLGRGSAPSHKLKPVSAPQIVKRPVDTFKDIFTSATEPCHNTRPNGTEEVEAFLQKSENSKNSLSEKILKELQSGPSSMIQLEQYEDDEDLILPSSRAQAVLSISDLCGPPLKPLVLQPKDEANLTEWFKSLWPSHAPNAAGTTANQFDWYFYQDRAIGFLLDMNCGSACIGRILLGSYMKKPLWVDHSASTVFNILSSSVSVVIDNRESRYDAGQCFTVQCGHAYSIQNVTAQPAALYFSRILEET